MKKKWRITPGIAFGLIFLSCLVRLGQWAYNFDDGFSLRKVTSDLSYDQEWEVPLSAQFYDNYLGQKYHYLGKGAQCFAFGSADNEYVLKLFKHQHLKKITWPDKIWLPAPVRSYYDARNRRRQKKQRDHFHSYKLAYEQLRDETGLVMLHLNKKEEGALSDKVTIVTQRGKEFDLNLDQMEFIVQRRAQMLYPYLTSLMEQGKKDEAAKMITQAIDLVRKRLQKGIIDTDPAFGQNYGVVSDGRVIAVDVGRFVKVETPLSPKMIEEQVKRSTYHFHKWIAENHPELSCNIKSN